VLLVSDPFSVLKAGEAAPEAVKTGDFGAYGFDFSAFQARHMRALIKSAALRTGLPLKAPLNTGQDWLRESCGLKPV